MGNRPSGPPRPGSSHPSSTRLPYSLSEECHLLPVAILRFTRSLCSPLSPASSRFHSPTSRKTRSPAGGTRLRPQPPMEAARGGTWGRYVATTWGSMEAARGGYMEAEHMGRYQERHTGRHIEAAYGVHGEACGEMGRYIEAPQGACGRGSTGRPAPHLQRLGRTCSDLKNNDPPEHRPAESLRTGGQSFIPSAASAASKRSTASPTDLTSRRPSRPMR